jgi:hypothetical protein
VTANPHWSDALVKLGACQGRGSGGEWAATQPTPEAAWAACARPDWMFWISEKLGVDLKLMVLAACDCARLALPYSGTPCNLECIELTEAWCRGEVTIEQLLIAATRASYAAAAYAAYAAADAVRAARAARAARSAAADAARAARAARAAAAAAADYAAYAADAAREQTLAKCCELIRARIPMPSLEAPNA